MEIKIDNTTPAEVNADVLIVLLPHITTEDDEIAGLNEMGVALAKYVTQRVQAGDFTGELNTSILLFPNDGLAAERLLAVGLGDVNDDPVDAIRQAAATAISKIIDMPVTTAAAMLPMLPGDRISGQQMARALVEGALLAGYRYVEQKSDSDSVGVGIESLVLLVDEVSETITEGVEVGRAFADGTNMARDLVNRPPNICTPSHMADEAAKMASSVGLEIAVLERQQMRALKMGALLGVAQGSETPPRFIILEHNAHKKEELPTVVLVGKGVTFDTGGYSIKTRDGMIGMKADMSGGAAVIGAMRIIGTLDVPLHVVGLIPAADNMISGKAYRPQDVITASNGKTIEIISTDAEGRLLLADALVYAKRYDPAAVVDIATLTGSMKVALGHAAAGFFSTDDGISDAIRRAGDTTRERVWQMPLFEEYGVSLESDVADTRNSGGRAGGAGVAAYFLSNFVDYPAWAHIDMAGMMSGQEGLPYHPKSTSPGFGARLLAEFVREWVR